MLTMTFSDCQTADALKITRATLLTNDPRLLVEMGDSFIKVFGDGAEADASMLDAIRDEQNLRFLVFRSLEPRPN